MRAYLITEGVQVTPIDHRGDGYVYPEDYQHLIPEKERARLFNIQQHGAIYRFKDRLWSWGQLIDWAKHQHSYVVLGIYDSVLEPEPLLITPEADADWGEVFIV